MGFIFGGSSGKKEAKAITDSSQAEAAAAREAARGDVMAQQTMLAQDVASRKAEELISRPQGEVEVDLQSVANTGGDTLDPTTGRRRTKRQSYNAGGATSISI